MSEPNPEVARTVAKMLTSEWKDGQITGEAYIKMLGDLEELLPPGEGWRFSELLEEEE